MHPRSTGSIFTLVLVGCVVHSNFHWLARSILANFQQSIKMCAFQMGVHMTPVAAGKFRLAYKSLLSISSLRSGSVTPVQSSEN